MLPIHPLHSTRYLQTQFCNGMNSKNVEVSVINSRLKSDKKKKLNFFLNYFVKVNKYTVLCQSETNIVGDFL